MGFSWRTHLLQCTCNKNLTNLMWKTWTCELGLSRNFPMTYKRNYIRLNYKIFYANICFLNESVTLMINPAKSYVYQKVNHTKHRTILFNTGFYISLIYGILCTFEYLFYSRIISYVVFALFIQYSLILSHISSFVYYACGKYDKIIVILCQKCNWKRGNVIILNTMLVK